MNAIILLWAIIGIPFLGVIVYTAYQNKWFLAILALVSMGICALCAILHNKIYQRSGRFWP